MTDAAKPPRSHVPVRDWLGFLFMVLGMFMAILDIQIVASSLSEIQAGLSASADEISWVQTSYLIAEVVMIPLSGYLARLFSTRYLFVASALAFAATSAACAFADSIETMIVCRALQGFVGGGMIPTVFATAYKLFPPDRRSGMTVMIGLVATMAPTLGPSLGGYITESFSWHWLFLINIVPGMVVAAGVWMLIDVDQPDWDLLTGFDLPGLALMALFLGSLEYVLEEGTRQDWFADPTIRYLAVVAASSGALFFWRTLTYYRPIVDLWAFADRNFAIGCLYSFIIGTGLYGAVYMLPLFLARVRGYNALQIGEVMFVTGMFQFLTAPIVGRLARSADLRVMLAFGLSLFAGGLYLNSFLTAQSSFWELFLPQAMRGTALMFCFIPVNILALGTLPHDKLNNASGLFNLMRNLGGAIALAAINTAFQERFALHWARLVDNVNLVRPGIRDFIDGVASRMGDIVSADPTAVATKLLANMVQREATVLTFNDCLLLLGLGFVFGLTLLPLARKPKSTDAAAEAH